MLLLLAYPGYPLPGAPYFRVEVCVCICFQLPCHMGRCMPTSGELLYDIKLYIFTSRSFLLLCCCCDPYFGAVCKPLSHFPSLYPFGAISFRLWMKVSQCMLSGCFWTPISLGHPGSFMSIHDLKCMHVQNGHWF